MSDASQFHKYGEKSLGLYWVFIMHLSGLNTGVVSLISSYIPLGGRVRTWRPGVRYAFPVVSRFRIL